MSEKDITTISWLIQGIPVIFAALLSTLGGVVSYLTRMVQYNHPFNFLTFLIEIITSGFVGVVSFMLCDAADFGWSTTAAIVAISGHMGARSLTIFEQIGIDLLSRKIGYDYSKTKISGTEENTVSSKNTPPQQKDYP